MPGKWAKPNGHWEWIGDDLDPHLSANILPRPADQTGDHWGSWVYDADLRTLTFRQDQHDYEVPLNEITDAAKALDWLAQLEEKTWMTSQGLGDFVRALRALVGLRKLAHSKKTP